MKKVKARPRRKSSPFQTRAVQWAIVLAVAGLAIYGFSQMSSIVYTEANLRAIDFSSLSAKQRRNALETAHQARCTCGCGMNLAQCVATDMTCPVRERNIESIRAMVRNASRSD